MLDAARSCEVPMSDEDSGVRFGEALSAEAIVVWSSDRLQAS